MKNYVIKPGTRGMFSVNLENNEFDVVDPMSSHIDWVYDVPEDGVLKIANGEDKQVKAGDKIIVFYTSPYTKHVAVVVSNEEWNENVKLEREYNEKMVHKADCDRECDCKRA